MTDINHTQASESHTRAAQAHRAAAAAHDRGDLDSAQDLTSKAHECSTKACKHTKEIAKIPAEPVHAQGT